MFLKLSKTCHVGSHMKALAESYQMNINVAGFQLCFNVFTLFYCEPISHQ